MEDSNRGSQSGSVQCFGMIHVVKQGDTLYNIGKKYGVKVSALMAANPYLNVYNLQIGDELCVPRMQIDMVPMPISNSRDREDVMPSEPMITLPNDNWNIVPLPIEIDVDEEYLDDYQMDSDGRWNTDNIHKSLLDNCDECQHLGEKYNTDREFSRRMEMNGDREDRELRDLLSGLSDREAVCKKLCFTGDQTVNDVVCETGMTMDDFNACISRIISAVEE